MNLIVVNELSDLPEKIPGARIITAKEYLSSGEFDEIARVRIYNLCRSYRYQGVGYYVSLLASARKQKVFPEIQTVQDTRANSIIRLKTEEMENLVQETFSGSLKQEFILQIFFGRTVHDSYASLANHIYRQFPAPFLKVHFIFLKKKWHLQQVSLVPFSDLEQEEKAPAIKIMKDFFSSHRHNGKKQNTGYHLAILINHDEADPPSNNQAIENFISAAERSGIRAVTIGKEDYSHIGDYDALFIRETTAVNHYTYRFARRAVMEGLVSIDDPQSILKCCNKVYLAELLNKHKIATPSTKIIHRHDPDENLNHFKFPFILKVPDSAFSAGVKKVENVTDLKKTLEEMFDSSELLIAQEYFPTSFDWRIGIMDKQPLFACKYFMVDGHWQIINSNKTGNEKYGEAEMVPLKNVPSCVLENALKASHLVGDGLYGVDLKQINGNSYVIEINDNPNIDAGIEDMEHGDKLYDQIIKIFHKRLNQQKPKRR